MGENANLVAHSSNIVSAMPHVADKSFQNLEIFGIFHNYPCGIVNPAFTGMLLWEILYNHDLNDYQICEYHTVIHVGDGTLICPGKNRRY